MKIHRGDIFANRTEQITNNEVVLNNKFVFDFLWLFQHYLHFIRNWKFYLFFWTVFFFFRLIFFLLCRTIFLFFWMVHVLYVVLNFPIVKLEIAGVMMVLGVINELIFYVYRSKEGFFYVALYSFLLYVLLCWFSKNSMEFFWAIFNFAWSFLSNSDPIIPYQVVWLW